MGTHNFEQITVNGINYGIISAEKTIRVMVLSHTLEKGSIVGVFRNIKTVIGMEFETFKKCVQKTSVKLAFMAPMKHPSDSKMLLIDMVLLPSKEHKSMTKICTLITYEGLIECVQYAQDTLYDNRFKSDKTDLAIYHRLTLGDDPKRWTAQRAVRAVWTISKPDLNHIAVNVNTNSIEVINTLENIVYTFFKDKKGFMNLLSIKKQMNRQ